MTRKFQQLLKFMASIFKQKLGDEFKRLHPKLQQQFSLSSHDQIAFVGVGVMEKVWRGKFYTMPLLYLGRLRNISFPNTGEMIPFPFESNNYLDSYGRESMPKIRK